jgi:zinc transporter 9
LSTLVGEEGIEIKTLNHIVEIIKQNELIKDVKSEKAVMIGTRKFRFYADITFDVEVIIHFFLYI